MIVVKKPGIWRLCCACLGAYWLAGIINPGFVWVSLLIFILMLLFFIEELFSYFVKENRQSE